MIRFTRDVLVLVIGLLVACVLIGIATSKVFEPVTCPAGSTAVLTDGWHCVLEVK